MKQLWSHLSPVRLPSPHRYSLRQLPSRLSSAPLFPFCCIALVLTPCLPALFPSHHVSAASLELTIPAKLQLSIDPAQDNGYAKSADSTVTIKTDAHWGYNFSIKSASASTNAKTIATTASALKNGASVINSIDEAIELANFQSSGAPNTWGYLPSKFGSDGAPNTKLQPGPGATPQVIESTTTPGTNAAVDYTFAIAAKVDDTTASGEYTNTFVFAVAANEATYTINYNLNGGTWDGGASQADGAPQSNNSQTGATTETSVDLVSAKPARLGHVFKGWCSVATTTDSCTGDVYQPGQTWTLPSNDSTLDLWAMWKAFPTVLQEFTSSDCAEMVQGDQITLSDSRDSNTYTVAKLKDNKCWMTQNLRLGDDTIKSRTIGPTDSDTTHSFTLPNSSPEGFPMYDMNLTAYFYIDPSATPGHETYGGYYSWLTATAGTGPTNVTGNGNASGSICPKNWRLPKYTAGGVSPGGGPSSGGSTGPSGDSTSDSPTTGIRAPMPGGSGSTEYTNLVAVYNTGDGTTTSEALRSTDAGQPGFVLAGYYNNSSPAGQGTTGHYWSAGYGGAGSAANIVMPFYLELSSGSAGDGTSAEVRNNGMSVRCLID